MNRVFLSALFAAFVVAGLMIYQATSVTASSVHLPSELLRFDQTQSYKRLRVGGRIADRPINYQTDPKLELSFQIEDPYNPQGSIPVIYHGLRPDMFNVGRDVIVDGMYEQAIFQASSVLTQCPSKYEPPKPSEVYRAPEK